MKILEVKDLCKNYGKGSTLVKALDEVSFSVEEGEFVAIVGSSGSGKSTLLHILGAVDKPTSGKVVIGDIDVFKQKDDALAVFRRRKVGLIYQFYNLIPILNVEENMTLPILLDGKSVDKNYLKELIDILGLERRINHLPNELSGGQQQRVSIGRALISRPDIILADEPTGNLDSKASREIMDLLRLSNEKYGQTIIMITHDLGVVASICDRIAIMYGGKIVEMGTTDEIFYSPKHPYTKGLLSCISNPEDTERKELHPIPGSPPDLLNISDGCPFVDRCEDAMNICPLKMDEYREYSATHICSCWLGNPMALKKGE